MLLAVIEAASDFVPSRYITSQNSAGQRFHFERTSAPRNIWSKIRKLAKAMAIVNALEWAR